MKKSVIIVGAGIAGLSAGCYARMNGFKTNIFEMHKIPGGLCTAWHKKGYSFDISMHMLTGSLTGPYHRMWEELGVTDKFDFYYHDDGGLIEGMGKKLILSTDRKQLEEDMIAISPADTKMIKEFTSILFGPDLMKTASLDPPEFIGFLDKLKSIQAMIPMYPLFWKYGKMTIQQFAAGFHDPFLQHAVRFFVDSPGWPMPGFPMVALLGFIKNGINQAGAPLGGSKKVAFHIADLFRNLGGHISYNSKVSGLVIENNQVRGIKLRDGSEHYADYVIWAADGHYLIYDLLGGRYVNEKIARMFERWTPVKPIVHVMMGVNHDFSSEPHKMIIEMEKPIQIGNRTHNWMSVINHSFDKSMAPVGKSELEVWFDTEYEYWEQLANNRKEYYAEKKRIAYHVIDLMEKRYPGFTSWIEIADVPTPVTYNRYTGNWKGSPDGWYITVDNLDSMDEPLRGLPGLEDLYTIGQWTQPFTGTIMAALSGRQMIQLLCRKDAKTFVSKHMTEYVA
jgi:phytoene dehydrogenase-like protein